MNDVNKSSLTTELDIPSGMSIDFIQINRSKGKLKYLAKKDLKSNSLLLVEEPFVAFPDLSSLNRKKFHCNRCFTISSVKSSIQCPNCKANYCKEECLKDDQQNHKSSCNHLEGERSVYSKLVSMCQENGQLYVIPILVAKIALRLMDQDKQMEDWTRINSLKANTELKPEFMDETWSAFEEEIIPLIPESKREAFNKDWYNKMCFVVATHGCILPLPLGEEKESEDLENMSIYMGLYPLFSLGFGCSCESNSTLDPVRSGTHPAIAILTSRVVKKGEELTLFGDHCECPKCLSIEMENLKVSEQDKH